jgi:hypothetical protein
MRYNKVIFLSWSSLVLFCLSFFLPVIFHWGTPESWWLWILQLTIGWKLFPRENMFWLIIRAIYIFAVWCGLRGFIQTKYKSHPVILAAGLISICALLAAIGGLMFLPSLNY